MPQFDIASFYPQISYFAVILLFTHVFLLKGVLPKISRNLKLGGRLMSAYAVAKGPRDLNMLSYIYNAATIIPSLSHREILSITYSGRFVSVILGAYVGVLNLIMRTREKDFIQGLCVFNKTYITILGDTAFVRRSAVTRKT